MSLRVGNAASTTEATEGSISMTEADPKPTVYLSSPTNSTLFTTCCHVAICEDQVRCPGCGEEVKPRSQSDRWKAAYNAKRRYFEVPHD